MSVGEATFYDRGLSLSRLTNQALTDEEERTVGAVVEVPFLADSYAEDWERIERHAARRPFARGEEIVREGEVDRSLIIVLSGELEFVREGRVMTVIVAPSVVGEVAFFNPGPRLGTLRARADGELLQLGFEQFESLAASSPSLARMILLDAGRILAMRLRNVIGAAAQ